MTDLHVPVEDVQWAVAEIERLKVREANLIRHQKHLENVLKGKDDALLRCGAEIERLRGLLKAFADSAPRVDATMEGPRPIFSPRLLNEAWVKAAMELCDD